MKRRGEVGTEYAVQQGAIDPPGITYTDDALVGPARPGWGWYGDGWFGDWPDSESTSGDGNGVVGAGGAGATLPRAHGAGATVAPRAPVPLMISWDMAFGEFNNMLWGVVGALGVAHRLNRTAVIPAAYNNVPLDQLLDIDPAVYRLVPVKRIPVRGTLLGGPTDVLIEGLGRSATDRNGAVTFLPSRFGLGSALLPHDFVLQCARFRWPDNDAEWTMLAGRPEHLFYFDELVRPAVFTPEFVLATPFVPLIRFSAQLVAVAHEAMNTIIQRPFVAVHLRTGDAFANPILAVPLASTVSNLLQAASPVTGPLADGWVAGANGGPAPVRVFLSTDNNQAAYVQSVKAAMTGVGAVSMTSPELAEHIKQHTASALNVLLPDSVWDVVVDEIICSEADVFIGNAESTLSLWVHWQRLRKWLAANSEDAPRPQDYHIWQGHVQQSVRGDTVFTPPTWSCAREKVCMPVGY